VDPILGAVDVKVNEIADMAIVRGHGRLPSDLGSELLDVLGDVCRVVVCDLSGMAAAGVASIVDALTPAGCYLRAWSGTALVAYVPDEAVRHMLARTMAGERVLLPASIFAGEAQARACLPPLQSVTVVLPPWPRSAPQARQVVARALSDWDMGDLQDAAALVTAELVANAVVHAQTLLHLTAVRAGPQVRLAVRDRGGGRAASDPDIEYASSLHGRGLSLVQAFARGWGVLPARRQGKTVWAVLEQVPERPGATRQAGWVAADGDGLGRPHVTGHRSPRA